MPNEDSMDELVSLVSDLEEEISKLKEKKQSEEVSILVTKIDKLIDSMQGSGVPEDLSQKIAEAISKVTINAPEVNVSTPTINVPPIKIPPIPTPKIEVPSAKVYMPDEMAIKKPTWLAGLVDLIPISNAIKSLQGVIEALKFPTDPRDPVAVRLSNGEKFYNALGGMASAISGAFPFKKADSTDMAALVRDDGTLVVEVSNGSSITLDADQINLNTDQVESKLDDIIAAVEGATPAGTNAIGKLAANSGVDIGDVDVTSVVYPTALTTPASGELAGATSATQMPSVACKMARFKAVSSNAGNVYIGISGVTKIDGTTDTTTGFELLPGDDTGWIPVDNINRYYRICDNAGDDLTYLTIS